MRVVGVFNRRFDADLAIAKLKSAGIRGVVVADTNPETGNASLAADGFRVAVRREVESDAIDVLAAEDPGAAAQSEIDELDALYHRRRFSDRSKWIRYATWAVLLGVVGPILVTGLIEAGWLVDSLFP